MGTLLSCFQKNRNSLDSLLIEHELTAVSNTEQDAINYLIVERLNNIEENIKSLSEDIHLLHKSNHQSSSK
jgi:hypothetical protein